MSEHDQSDFLKTDTPANACTLSDRALRDAFRDSMDSPEERVGMLDQLTARINAMKSEQKSAKTKESKAAAPAEVEAPVEAKINGPVEVDFEDPEATTLQDAEAQVATDVPQDEEGELFAHLNEIMSEKVDNMPDLTPEPGMAQSKSVIVRTFASLMPKKKAKAAEKPATAPAPKAQKAESSSIVLGLLSRLKPTKKTKPATAMVTEAAAIVEQAPVKKPSKSIIVRMLSGLKPKPKTKAAEASTLRKEPSGSVVVAILKAISPIKRSA